ncbi:hypothetical protein I9H06_05565 [Pseudomonas tremae]|uniref:hypothetical protein n=1 Tax=Pseudomonas tremae TaxID=200454 RepID=UPI001F2AF129|nr:hypothetical protein [Pseudomonas tremae]MCF5715582.1 hypothetical protein [Pseudomonas tremae]UQB32743.1 hypothetical protein I9H06_05565 [Pseudomonas tremae]
MGKRKIFIESDLSIPQVEHSRNAAGNVLILAEVIPPRDTTVKFERNASTVRSFDFSRWYGVGIDSITYACQRQIERFVAGQDHIVATATVTSYCGNGLRNFLDCCMLHGLALDRELTLADLDRNLIDHYLGHLADLGVTPVTQKTLYTHTKPVLLQLGRRGLFPLVSSGDMATFPTNPFPNSNRKAKGETPLSKRERQIFMVALRQAIKPIWVETPTVTCELMALALLVVALHTGRNSTPLLEMGRDCLRTHPKDDTTFLVLWKRRGYNTSKVALRAESDGERLLESTPSVRTNVELLIRHIMTLTAPLDADAPKDLKGRVWLYRDASKNGRGQVRALTKSTLALATNRLIAEHSLTDSNGMPLRMNVSRLRKTFGNRIFELTGGDLSITAAALGNTLQVADQHYLAPGENARRNWQFMGEVLVEELLTRTIGATYWDTPMGRCTDPVNGQYAPKREGATCMNFINCLRCKHYAVTADDLHKLFSFYFRVMGERSRMDKRRWEREYAHIPRLIDRYIVAEGIRRGTFKEAVVESAREHARTDPHPFWSVDLIDSLEVFA